MKDELTCRIALQLVEGVGDIVSKTLLGYCGSAAAIFRQKKNSLLKIPGVGEKTATAVSSFSAFDIAEKEILFMEKHQIKPLFYLDAEYPSRLKNYEDSPVMLYYRGNANLNNSRVLAVVGTRKATTYGRHFCEMLAEALMPFGCLVISGLAHGTDANIHKACVKQHIDTVGVLGHGFATMYPAGNKLLAREMLLKGGLLTEYLSSKPANAEHFPQRNRIVAGMCDALVVVESAYSGGSLITAEIANSYNKDVYALPGRCSDEYSQGCNRLIRQHKAAIIEDIHSLLKELGWQDYQNKPSKPAVKLSLSETEQHVIQYLQDGEKGIDDIHYHTCIDISRLSLILLDLEFKQAIRSLPGKRYALQK